MWSDVRSKVHTPHLSQHEKSSRQLPIILWEIGGRWINATSPPPPPEFHPTTVSEPIAATINQILAFGSKSPSNFLFLGIWPTGEVNSQRHHPTKSSIYTYIIAGSWCTASPDTFRFWLVYHARMGQPRSGCGTRCNRGLVLMVSSHQW